MRTSSHKVNDGGIPEGEVRSDATEDQGGPVEKGEAKDFRVEIRFEQLTKESCEALILVLSGALEQAKREFARLSGGAQAVICSNPACKKVMASERACFAVFTVRDYPTMNLRNVLSCSYQCHSINQETERNRMVKRT